MVPVRRGPRDWPDQWLARWPGGSAPITRRKAGCPPKSSSGKPCSTENDLIPVRTFAGAIGLSHPVARIRPAGYTATMSENFSEKSRPGVTQAILDWHATLPDDRLAHLVRDARRGLSRCLQMRLGEFGIASGHWTFLRILWVRDGLTQRELSDLAGVMEPTTFAALQAMEKLGYINRRRRPDNRKNIYVYLTEAGSALRDTLVPMAEDINESAVRGVSPEDVAATRRALLAMIQNLAAYEAEGTNERRRVPSTRELARLAKAGDGVAGASSPKPPRAPRP